MLTIEKKSLKVGKYVDTQHVNTVIQNYKTERWVHNSKRLGKQDSMSAWFSAEELEDYLAKIKEHGGDGVRFYFAAYDKDYAQEPKYAGRQTIVLVATKSKESETGVVNKDLYISTENGNTILAYNNSDLCPPYNCPGGKSGGVGGDDDWGGIGTTLVDCGNDGLLVV